jgi:hypothetical protein
MNPWLLCLAVLLLVWGKMGAQPAEPEFYRSEITRGLAPILDLRGKWLDVDDGSITVPFCDQKSDRRDLGKLFDVPDYTGLPSKVFLYIEGLSWTAEVKLNGALLAVTEDPFSEYLLPLQKEWLNPVGNKLEVILRRSGPSKPLYPNRFLGIYRQIFILGPDSLERAPRIPQKTVSASRAVVIAPWTIENGIVYDTLAVGKALQGMFAYPEPDPVYFPFRPSAQTMDLAARLGVKVLLDIGGADSVAFYNKYPVSPEAGAFFGRFWRDEKNRPTEVYGTYFSQESLERRDLALPDKIALLTLLLGPVLMMLLLKLITPRLYASLPEYLTKTKIYLELIAGAKFLKDQQRWAMNLMRMVFTAIFVSLYLYYVSLSGDWTRLNILSSESFLYHYFEGTMPSLYQIFMQVLGVVAGLNLLKYFMLNLTGSIFRVFGFSSTLQNLDIFASFPLNFLPILPGAVIFFLAAETGTVLMHVWHALILIYFLRRLILVFNGLTKLFQFSTGIKILYICSLELAPWIFLI